jgi:quinoprotein dehydrogenase-associated probable ABC transporter substrate-binding protein
MTAAAATSAHADDGLEGVRAFRVCEDPNNLPFSNQAQEGIENRIAKILAGAMNLPLEHFWYPQRVNFVRNTLRYKLPGDAEFRCDVMMGVPAGFDQVATTRPYYHSTYALVYVNGRKLDGVATGADFIARASAAKGEITIGLYDRSPATQWVTKHRLNEQSIPYRILNADPEHYPGQIIEKDLMTGKIDAAIVWGPIAGFFAKRAAAPGLTVIPLQSEPGVKFDFGMAIGVRHGEPAWRDAIQARLDAHAPAIEAVLREFGVPLVDETGKPRQ